MFKRLRLTAIFIATGAATVIGFQSSPSNRPWPPGLQKVSDDSPASEYLDALREVPGLREAVEQLGSFETPGLMAAASELVFEGLHLHQKLNKERHGGRFAYHA